MLQLFRKNISINILLLLPYIFIIHGGRFFINHEQNSLQHSWLFNSLIKWTGLSEPVMFYLSHLLIFIQAIILTHLCNRIKVVPEGQLFPALLFIILTGFHTSIFGLSGILVANLFFILAIQSICSIYLIKNASLTLFNFGMYIGLASIFYAPYIWMLLLGIFGLTVFRGFILKEFLQILTGTGTVFYLFNSYLYLKGSSSVFWQDQILDFFSPYIFSMVFNSKGMVALALILFLFVFIFIKFNIIQVKAQIAAQKFFDFLFWICLCSFFSILFCKMDTIGHIIILITPLSIFLSVVLSRVKNELLAETTHLFFALLALFLQLQNW